MNEQRPVGTLLDLIGNTPLIRLDYYSREIGTNVYGKLECFNPGGSTKDRMALYIVEKAEREGKLKPGGYIIECTSGNTGRSFAMIATIKGYKCIFTITDKVSEEKRKILAALGAEVVVCPSNVAPEDPRSYYSRAREFHEKLENSIFINQYYNQDNVEAHYQMTGKELWEQSGSFITHFVASLGTCGTISGVSKYLKEQKPSVQVLGVDAHGSVLRKYFEEGVFDKNEIHSYELEGVGKNIIPGTFLRQYIDHVEQVHDGDSIEEAIHFAKHEGFLIGPSGGAVIEGIYQMKDRFGPDDHVVLLLADNGSQYISKLFNAEWLEKKGFSHLIRESVSNFTMA